MLTQAVLLLLLAHGQLAPEADDGSCARSDRDGSGAVDVVDLLLLLSAYGTSEGGGTGGLAVGVEQLLRLLAQFGRDCPASEAQPMCSRAITVLDQGYRSVSHVGDDKHADNTASERCGRDNPCATSPTTTTHHTATTTSSQRRFTCGGCACRSGFGAQGDPPTLFTFALPGQEEGGHVGLPLSTPIPDGGPVEERFRCGTEWAGWLSGWPGPHVTGESGRGDGGPPEDYAVPFDPANLPAEGGAPVAATVCFANGHCSPTWPCPCSGHAAVRVARCGIGLVWELPPSPDCASGYCAAPLPLEALGRRRE